MPTLYTKMCKQCNGSFSVIPRNKTQKYCGIECSRDSTRNLNKLYNCLVCDSKLNRRQQSKFCSMSCSAIHNNSIRSAESRAKQQNSLNKMLLENRLSRSDPKDAFYKKCFFRTWKLDTWKKIPGYNLIAITGKFHPINNKTGAVRDHLVSKYDAFIFGYDPKYISHPANCRIISNLDNIIKGTKSSITYIELLERISKWCE